MVYPANALDSHLRGDYKRITLINYGSLKIEKLLKIFFLGQLSSNQEAKVGDCDFDSFASLICAGIFWRERDVMLAPFFSRSLDGKA